MPIICKCKCIGELSSKFDVYICIYFIHDRVYIKVGQPPARGPDPAHEGLASGPPPCSAITLQSGPRIHSQTNAGFMSEITSHECTSSEHFGRPRESRCTLRRLLIKYKNSKSRCRQTNSNNYNVGLLHIMTISSRTVPRRIEEMSDNVHYSLKIRISTLVAFFLALDESTDAKDTAQLAVFIRGVTAELNVCEEFLQLVPLRGTTTGKDIFDAMFQCVEQYFLDLSHLVCVTTDGAPAMTGQKKGAATLLVRHCEAA